MSRADTTDAERIAGLYAQRARLAAELCAVEDGTLPWIERRSSTTPGELAEEFGLSEQAANNRLSKLVRVGLLRRWRVSVNGGGKAFAYTVPEVVEAEFVEALELAEAERGDRA